MMRRWLWLWGALAMVSCGGQADTPPSAPSSARTAPSPARPVTPPFPVRGEAEGLLLVWVDEAGAAHSATKRSDIPEARRQRVRVDSLELPPDKRLDPDHVYVADLRAAQPDGSYRVEKWSREALEALDTPAAPGQADAPAAPRSAAVVLYGASWCGACKQAAAFMTERHIAFEEKDIEHDPAARAEMLQKARAQGLSAQGIPLLDVRGKMLSGFSPEALLAALDRGT